MSCIHFLDDILTTRVNSTRHSLLKILIAIYKPHFSL